jgi:hypothetical protein
MTGLSVNSDVGILFIQYINLFTVIPGAYQHCIVYCRPASSRYHALK